MNTQFADIQALKSLKYFSLATDGRLCLRSGVAKHIIDAHTHIGWGFFDTPPEPTEYVFPVSGAPIDLSHYSAHDYTLPLVKRARRETVRAVLARGRNYHCSASHLERDLEDLRITRAVVLAVDIFGKINSEIVLQTAGRKSDMFIPFISLHPRKKFNHLLIKKYVARGARGMKIHPPMQLVRPNSRYVCSMMELATIYKLPVLFHCGHSPLSPNLHKRFSNMEDYRSIVSLYKNVPIILGHSGIDEWEEAVAIAKKYEHVYLELSGQPPSVIKKMIRTLGGDRLLFGSDWPYYPTALPLAKVLLATEGDEKVREKILYTNSNKLLKKTVV
ncbi:MAG: amidohydrolase family protein [Microgenomates group bacterium]